VSGSHRLEHPSGTSGLLTPQGDWSVQVDQLTGPDVAGWLDAALRWAGDREALDLRSSIPLPGSWPVEAAGREHALAVPVLLAGAEATRALGRRVGRGLRAGDLVVLSGPLGAGKTTFTQGLAEALEVRGAVTSPTFVLARLHRGPVPLAHVDAYRLRDAGAFDLDDLDLDAALEDAVTVVEWGEGIVERLAESWLTVTFRRPTGAAEGAAEDQRVATVAAHGPRWAGRH
jgi:tRNA threonylcarbamoyladenosine biosynthesis protein TsaE